METRKMRLIIKTKYILLFCVVTFFASCDRNTIYQDFVSINKAGWNQDSIAVFSVDVKDTTNNYNVIIDIRNRNEYPYQNLFLFVSSYSPDNICVSDTLNCILSDELGRWYGKGIGSISNLPILYMSDIKFPKPGIYKFQIRHGMRETILKGMNDIGLRVEKIDQKEENK